MLGWMPIIATEKIAQVGSVQGLALIIAGGLSYTLGTLFLSIDEKYPYFHAIWHLLVIVGSICHFLFLLNWVAMWQPTICSAGILSRPLKNSVGGESFADRFTKRGKSAKDSPPTKTTSSQPAIFQRPAKADVSR